MDIKSGERVKVQGSKLYPDGYTGTVERILMVGKVISRIIVIPDDTPNKRHYVAPFLVSRI